MRSPVSLVANPVLRCHVPGPHDSWTFQRKILQRIRLPHGPWAGLVA